MKYTEDCPKCGQPSTCLLSLGYCGHCDYRATAPLTAAGRPDGQAPSPDGTFGPVS